MSTRIVQTSPKLCTFLNPLIESLSEPQRQHLRELCDTLLVCETEHTLACPSRKFNPMDESRFLSAKSVVLCLCCWPSLILIRRLPISLCCSAHPHR
jgi:hypothetical protein